MSSQRLPCCFGRRVRHHRHTAAAQRLRCAVHHGRFSILSTETTSVFSTAPVEIAQDGTQAGKQCLIEGRHRGWWNVASSTRYPLRRGVELAHEIGQERHGFYQPHAVSGPLAATLRRHHARRERESIIFDRCPPSELPVGRDLRRAVRVPAGARSAQ